MSHQFQVDDWVDWCETPKSPPGDYNRTCRDFLLDEQPLTGVKHLNPRQGITTGPCGPRPYDPHLVSVKHLNPRQGITTDDANIWHRAAHWCETPKSPPGDYNRGSHTLPSSRCADRCETPKSPPGDYNSTMLLSISSMLSTGVKHLNPRQGITTKRGSTFAPRTRRGVKHLNPRQGITTGRRSESEQVRCWA